MMSFAGLLGAAAAVSQVGLAAMAAVAGTAGVMAGVQVYRHRDWMAIILPRLAAGEPGAMRQLVDVLLERGDRNDPYGYGRGKQRV